MSDYSSVPGFYQNKLLTKDEEKQLVKLVKSGSVSARDELILSNTRLVASIAKKYYRIPFEDAIMEGMKGLIRGIDRYNGSINVRISTYVTWWIHHSLRRYDEVAAMIRIPSGKRGLLYKIGRIKRNYGEDLPPTELAQRLSDETGKKFTAEDVTEYCTQQTKSRIQSLDEKVLFIEPAIELKEEITNLESFLGDSVSCLSPRERYVIEMRFMSRPAKKLHEVGSSLGITRERVRQIEGIALNKLRFALGAQEL